MNGMHVFSSMEAALREGFQWWEYRAELGLHVVIRDFPADQKRLARALAFARPDGDD